MEKTGQLERKQMKLIWMATSIENKFIWIFSCQISWTMYAYECAFFVHCYAITQTYSNWYEYKDVNMWIVIEFDIFEYCSPKRHTYTHKQSFCNDGTNYTNSIDSLNVKSTCTCTFKRISSKFWFLNKFA